MSTTIVNPTPTEDWRTGLSDDLKADKSLESFKSVGDLAKSYTETKKMVGNAIHIPKPDAPKEVWDAYRAKLGRPDSPDKYEFKYAEGQTPFDKPIEDKLRTISHRLGHDGQQAQGLSEAWRELQAETAAAREQGIAELKKEWGGKFDTNLSLAQKAIKALGDDKLIAYLNASKLGDDPMLVRAFAKYGESMTEGPLVMGDGNQDATDAQSIQTKIDEIRRNPKHAHNDPTASREARAAAIAEMSRLYQRLEASRQS